MKSTHWSHSDDPEQWMDNPEKTPEEAARQLIEHDDSDLASDIRDDLMRGGSPIEITVYGYVETNEALDPEQAFDGYEPGCTYFTPTDEEITVVAEVAYRVKSAGDSLPNPSDQRAGLPGSAELRCSTAGDV